MAARRCWTFVWKGTKKNSRGYNNNHKRNGHTNSLIWSRKVPQRSHNCEHNTRVFYECNQRLWRFYVFLKYLGLFTCAFSRAFFFVNLPELKDVESNQFLFRRISIVSIKRDQPKKVFFFKSNFYCYFAFSRNHPFFFSFTHYPLTVDIICDQPIFCCCIRWKNCDIFSFEADDVIALNLADDNWTCRLLWRPWARFILFQLINNGSLCSGTTAVS